MPGRVPPVRPAGSQISARPSPPPRCPHVANKLLPTGWPVPIAARNLLHPGWPVPTIRSPSARRSPVASTLGRVASTLAGPVPNVRKFSDPKKIIKNTRALLAPWSESPAPWLGRCRKSENFPTR
ncbi:hypothetical protein MIMGU_mgv11b024245mg [Erythranthe guttata]|uniref:Uncharacterized protein n=1 Tax=Erythranthe guttata TaxID=4155 RepID=A0A022Q1H2_ERYGU|nr:hypothetical protein MIMGU_mgv11b024245mg [Erythranthe guttata]